MQKQPIVYLTLGTRALLGPSSDGFKYKTQPAVQPAVILTNHEKVLTGNQIYFAAQIDNQLALGRTTIFSFSLNMIEVCEVIERYHNNKLYNIRKCDLENTIVVEFIK
jgi:hypothetical protein